MGLGVWVTEKKCQGGFCLYLRFPCVPCFFLNKRCFWEKKKRIGWTTKILGNLRLGFRKRKKSGWDIAYRYWASLPPLFVFCAFFFFLFLFFLFSHLPNRAGPGHSSLLLSSLGGGASLSLRVWRRGVKLGSRLWAESWLWAGTRKEKKIEDTPLDCY